MRTEQNQNVGMIKTMRKKESHEIDEDEENNKENENE